MIESYLADGRQNQPEVFGCSITDPLSRLGKYRGLGRRNLCYLDKISEKGWSWGNLNSFYEK